MSIDWFTFTAQILNFLVLVWLLFDGFPGQGYAGFIQHPLAKRWVVWRAHNGQLSVPGRQRQSVSAFGNGTLSGVGFDGLRTSPQLSHGSRCIVARMFGQLLYRFVHRQHLLD